MEFAIVAPVFLIFLFASMEFSLVSMIRSSVNNAAYEGARLIVIPGADAAEGIAEAERILSVVGVRNRQVDVTPAVIDEDTRNVTVEVQVPVSENAFFTPWFLGGKVIRSRCTLKTERYEMR